MPTWYSRNQHEHVFHTKSQQTSGLVGEGGVWGLGGKERLASGNGLEESGQERHSLALLFLSPECPWCFRHFHTITLGNICTAISCWFQFVVLPRETGAFSCFLLL